MRGLTDKMKTLYRHVRGAEHEEQAISEAPEQEGQVSEDELRQYRLRQYRTLELTEIVDAIVEKNDTEDIPTIAEHLIQNGQYDAASYMLGFGVEFGRGGSYTGKVPYEWRKGIAQAALESGDEGSRELIRGYRESLNRWWEHDRREGVHTRKYQLDENHPSLREDAQLRDMALEVAKTALVDEQDVDRFVAIAEDIDGKYESDVCDILKEGADSMLRAGNIGGIMRLNETYDAGYMRHIMQIEER